MVAALLLCAEGDVCCALQLATLSQVAKDVWGTMEDGYVPASNAASLGHFCVLVRRHVVLSC
jgi:hypothetical protein